MTANVCGVSSSRGRTNAKGFGVAVDFVAAVVRVDVVGAVGVRAVGRVD